MEVAKITRPRPPGESRPRAFVSSAGSLCLQTREVDVAEALSMLETAARHLAIAIAGMRDLVGPVVSELVN